MSFLGLTFLSSLVLKLLRAGADLHPKKGVIHLFEMY